MPGRENTKPFENLPPAAQYEKGLSPVRRKELRKNVGDVVKFEITQKNSFQYFQNVVALTGTDASGKTGVIERIIPTLRAKGIEVIPLRGSGSSVEGTERLINIAGNPPELNEDLKEIQEWQKKYEALSSGGKKPDPGEYAQVAIGMQSVMFQKIRKWAERGKLVIVDRMELDTLLGGYERGGTKLLTQATENLKPIPYGTSIWLDVSPEVAVQRMSADSSRTERQRNPIEEIRERRYGYYQTMLASKHGNLLANQRMLRVNAEMSPDDVAESTIKALETYFPTYVNPQV